MLSQAEIGSFAPDGFIAVRGAVPPDVLRACQEEIWSALGDRGVLREDPSTWHDPGVRIPCPASEAFAAAGTQPVLWESWRPLASKGCRSCRRPGSPPRPALPGRRRW